MSTSKNPYILDANDNTQLHSPKQTNGKQNPFVLTSEDNQFVKKKVGGSESSNGISQSQLPSPEDINAASLNYQNKTLKPDDVKTLSNTDFGYAKGWMKLTTVDDFKHLVDVHNSTPTPNEVDNKVKTYVDSFLPDINPIDAKKYAQNEFSGQLSERATQTNISDATQNKIQLPAGVNVAQTKPQIFTDEAAAEKENQKVKTEMVDGIKNGNIQQIATFRNLSTQKIDKQIDEINKNPQSVFVASEGNQYSQPKLSDEQQQQIKNLQQQKDDIANTLDSYVDKSITQNTQKKVGGLRSKDNQLEMGKLKTQYEESTPQFESEQEVTNPLAITYQNFQYQQKGIDAAINAVSMDYAANYQAYLADTDVSATDRKNENANLINDLIAQKANLPNEYLPVQVNYVARLMGDKISSFHPVLNVFITDADRQKAIDELEKENPGFTQKYSTAIKYINDNGGIETNIPHQGFIGAFNRGGVETSEGVLNSVKDYFGLRNRGDRAADELIKQYSAYGSGTSFAGTTPDKIIVDKEGLAFKQIPNENYGKTNFNTVFNGLGEFTGGIIPFALLTEGVGELSGVVGKAAKMPLSKALQSKVGVTGATYLMNYDHNAEQADKLILDNTGAGDFKRGMVANLMTLGQAAAFNIMPANEFIRNNFTVNLAKDAMKFTEENALQNGLNKEALTKWLDDIVKPRTLASLKIAGKETLENVGKLDAAMLLQNHSNAIVSSLFDETGQTKNNDVIQQDIQTLKDATLGGLFFALPKLAHTPFSMTARDALYDHAQNADENIARINELQSKGLIAPEQANGIIKLINTARKNLDGLTTTNEKGLPTSLRQRKIQLAELVRKDVLDEIKKEVPNSTEQADASIKNADENIKTVINETPYIDLSKLPIMEELNKNYGIKNPLDIDPRMDYEINGEDISGESILSQIQNLNNENRTEGKLIQSANEQDQSKHETGANQSNGETLNLKGNDNIKSGNKEKGNESLNNGAVSKEAAPIETLKNEPVRTDTEKQKAETKTQEPITQGNEPITTGNESISSTEKSKTEKVVGEDLQSQQEEIENKRQQALSDAFEKNNKGNKGRPIPTSKKEIDEINAKADAELEALKQQQPEPTLSNKDNSVEVSQKELEDDFFHASIMAQATEGKEYDFWHNKKLELYDKVKNNEGLDKRNEEFLRKNVIQPNKTLNENIDAYAEKNKQPKQDNSVVEDKKLGTNGYDQSKLIDDIDFKLGREGTRYINTIDSNGDKIKIRVSDHNANSSNIKSGEQVVSFISKNDRNPQNHPIASEFLINEDSEHSVHDILKDYDIVSYYDDNGNKINLQKSNSVVDNTQTENKISSPINTEQNAVQKQSAGEVLQRQQEEAGKTGSERSGMEQQQQGEKTTEQSQKEKGIAAKGKELADKIRQLKTKQDILQTNIFGIPIAIYDGAIETVATAIEKGSELAEAIQKGIEFIGKKAGFDQENFIKHIEDFAAGEKPKIKVQVSGEGEPPKEPPKGTENFSDNPNKSERVRGAYEHLLDSKIDEDVKQKFKDNGIKYKIAKNESAQKVGRAMVDAYGTDEALKLARLNTFHASVNSAVFAEAINDYYNKERLVKDPQEKFDAAARWADTYNEYAELLTGAGQLIQYAYHFYKTSPLGFILSAKERLDERRKYFVAKDEKSLREAFEAFKDIPEFRDLFSQEVTEAAKKVKREVKAVDRQKIKDAWDKLKLDKNTTYATLVPPPIINGAIEVMKQAHLLGYEVADILKEGIKYINERHKEGWDEKKFKEDFKPIVENLLNETTTHKSRLEFYKDNLKKQIESLDKQIENKKRETKKQNKTELDDEAKDLIKQRDEKKKQLNEVVPPEKTAEDILKKWDKKLTKLEPAARKELLTKVLNEIVKNGGLEYDRFKEMYADALGLPSLTPTMEAKLHDLGNKLNQVDIARENLDKNPTQENIDAFKKAMREGTAASTQINDLLGDKGITLDRFLSIAKLNTLGVANLFVNPFFNVWFMPIKFLESMIKTGLDYGLKYAGFERADGIYENVFYKQRGYLKGFLGGSSKAVRNLYTGDAQFDYFQKISKQNIRPLDSFNEILAHHKGEKKLTNAEYANAVMEALPMMGGTAAIISRGLQLGDLPFRFAAERGMAENIALQKGLSGVAKEAFILSPDEVSAEKIRDAGQRAVMAQDNILTSALNNLSSYLKHATKESIGGKIGVGVTKIIGATTQPFLKIPLNSAMSAFELAVPEFSILKGIYHAVHGNRDLALNAFSRAVVGFALGMAASQIAKAGLVTTTSGDEKKIGTSIYQGDVVGSQTLNYTGFKRWLRGGNPEFADGDVTVNMNWLGIPGAIMQMYGQKNDEMTAEQWDKQGYLANLFERMDGSFVNGLKNNVFNNTSTLLQAMDGGGAYFVNKWLRGSTGILENAFDPSWLSTASRISDHYKADYSAMNLGEQLSSTLKERFWNGDNLPKQITVWGEKRTDAPKGTNPFLYYYADITKHRNVDTKDFGYNVLALYNRTKQDEVIPSRPSKTFQHNNTSIKLDPYQYEEFQTMVGQNRKQLTQALMNTDTWNVIGDEQKVDYLSKIYKSGYSLGKAEFLMKHPELDLPPTEEKK